MIKLNKLSKGGFCWSISKSSLKAFSEVSIKIDNFGEARVNTKCRACTNKNRERKFIGARKQPPKIQATNKTFRNFK